MTLSRKLGFIVVCSPIVVLSLLFLISRVAFGDVSVQQTGSANSTGLYRHYNFFATTSPQTAGYGTTTPDVVGQTQATSTNIVSWFSNGQLDNGTFTVAGAKQVTLFCGRGATSTNSGSTTCTFQVEGDSSGPWLYLDQLTNSASTSLAIAGTASQDQITVPTGTSTIAASTLSEGFWAVRCIVNITTDGAGFCSASADW